MKITDKYGNGIGLRTQFFSSTDLCTDPNNVGVVYPLKDTKGELQPSFGSVIDHQKGTILAFGEYRLAYGDGKEITYYKGRCLNIVASQEYETKVSFAEEIFGIKSELVDNTYLVDDRVGINEATNELIKIIKELDFEPEFVINPENLIEKKFTTPVFSKNEYPLFELDPFTMEKDDSIEELIELAKDIDDTLFLLDKEPEEVLTPKQVDTFTIVTMQPNELYELSLQELKAIKTILQQAKKRADAKISNN